MSELKVNIEELYIEIAKTRNSLNYIQEQVADIAGLKSLNQAIYEAGGVSKLIYIVKDRLESILDKLDDVYDFKPDYNHITKDNL